MMGIKFCKCCGVVEIPKRMRYCDKCREIVNYESRMEQVRKQKEKYRREMIEKRISRDLDQDVEKIQVLNEERHNAGLSSLSYGKWRAVQEGRITL